MEYQKTWWGNRFIASLETFIDSGRLQRGRAYRTDNRVLNFGIKENHVTATVRGNVNPYFGVTKEPKYKVSLTFEALSSQRWQTIIARLCENPGLLSKLMLNEMPNNIEDAFGTYYFLPRRYDDIEAQCSCPDYANPCKHIAGIYYRIASMLDRDPMLLFQLRGLAPEALHQALKKTELGKVFFEHLHVSDNISTQHQAYNFSEFKSSNKPKKLDHTHFWTMADIELPQREDDVANIDGPLIKKQGDYPAFWDRHNSFIGAMEDIYIAIRQKNKKIL